MKTNWEIGRLLTIVGLFFVSLIVIAASPGAGFNYPETPHGKTLATADSNVSSGIPILARENMPAAPAGNLPNPASLDQASVVTNSSSGGLLAMLGSRSLKVNLATVDGREILDKVAALPMTTWKYRGQEKQIRHMGPISENFKTAFQLGDTDGDITLVDESGVALAAIQGLNEKVESQAAELKDRDARIKSLEKRLDDLEKMMIPVAQR